MRGGYALIFELRVQRHLATKSKEFFLKPGVYVYSGSALGGIEQRIRRHIWNSGRISTKPSSKIKRRYHNHWHIDYLLPHSENLVIVKAESDIRIECLLIRNLKGQGLIGIKEFGSSDCRARCEGHLVYAQNEDIFTVVNRVIEVFKTICKVDPVVLHLDTKCGDD